MTLALQLAGRGRGKTSPNPLVGAVIARRGKIVGKGYHRRVGESHAEVNALKDAGSLARGSTLYVNLEPCSHWGRTPPCTEIIIKSGIAEVVIASRDPNPLVKGKGMRKLRSAGIKVRSGILRKPALRLNEAYLKYITTGKPFVILKVAASLDGKIATSEGESKWITCPRARDYGRRRRREVAGILVGIGTVLADDPGLRAKGGKRKESGPGPVRIILDRQLRIPLQARVLGGPVIIATTRRASPEKRKALEKQGAKILIIKEKEDKLDLRELVKELGSLGIASLLVEGGGEVNTSFLKENLVDKILFFIAPKIIGGTKSAVGELGISRLRNALRLSDITLNRFGDNFLVEGYIKR